jgi:hypothetical protein
VEEERVLLTRDRNLLKRRVVTRGLFVRAERPRRQLAEIVGRLQLESLARPLSRCLECNVPLEEADAEAARAARIPTAVLARHRRWRRCPGCGRLYWEGGHVRRMRAIVQEALGEAGAPGSPEGS